LNQFLHTIFVVDSGASHSSITRKTLEDFGLALDVLGVRRLPGEILGLGGTLPRVGMLSGLAFEHLDGSVSTVQLQLNVLPEAPAGVPALLGRDVLMLGKVLLDPESQTVSFDLPHGRHDLLR
jgi:hypothetical protein